MAKKKTVFQWDNEADDPIHALKTRENRAEHKRYLADLSDLADQLILMPAHELKGLPLDPKLLTALIDMKQIHNGPAKKRLRLRVNSLVQFADPETLKDAVGDGRISAKDLHLQTLEAWRERLLTEDALEDFIAAFPQSDRQRLRQMVRGVQKKPEDKKRRQNLFKYLREVSEPV